MLRLSCFSLSFSPSSRNFDATSRVTALTQSRVRPWSTKLLARLEEGSGVRIEGRLKGFFLGCREETESVKQVSSGMVINTYRRVQPSLSTKDFSLFKHFVSIFLIPEASKASSP